MKRKFYLFFLWGMVGIAPALAQEQVPEDEAAKRAEINEIKLSENAIYADVVEMVSDDNEAVSLAQQKSINMLQAHVIEVFAKRLHMEPKDVQEIWDVIDDKCQNIVVRKGDLFRVFTYIVKDAIGLGRRKPKEGDVEKYLMAKEEEEKEKKIVINLTNMLTGGQDSINYVAPPVSAQADTVVAPIPPAPVPATEVAQAVAPVQVQTAAPVQVQAAAPVQVQAAAPVQVQAAAPVQVQAAAPVQVQAAAPVQTQAAAPVQTPAVAPVQAPVAPVQPAIPEVVQTMFDKQDMGTLLKYLSAEKTAQHLMFGNSRTMTSPDKCYVVIIDKSTRQIVTILGTGTSERTNYKTLKADNLDNFKQGMYSAVFVQLY